MKLWSRLKQFFAGGKAAAEGPKESPPCLVMLLRKPMGISTKFLEQMILAELGVDLRGDGPGRTEFVVGDSPIFMAQFDGRIFQIMSMPGRYFEKEDSPELRIRKALAEHQGWVSVTQMMEYPDAKPGDTYQYLGKMLSGFGICGAALAIYWLNRQRIQLWHDDYVEILQGHDPLAVFSAMPTGQEPVLAVDRNDPRFQAAVAEARRRWPEFVAAFARREPETPFLIKAPFSDGDNRESMWLTVERIHEGTVTGRLQNEPVNVRGLERGQQVTVKLDIVEDWVYPEGGQLLGGFTQKAIQKIHGGA
jgi:uncharacterized protein YegJ (DUF2314 family)